MAAELIALPRPDPRARLAARAEPRPAAFLVMRDDVILGRCLTAGDARLAAERLAAVRPGAAVCWLEVKGVFQTATVVRETRP